MKKVTQLDLSLSIGYNSTSVIAKAEAGTEGRHFSVEQLYKIAKILNVPMSCFLKILIQFQKTNNYIFKFLIIIKTINFLL